MLQDKKSTTKAHAALKASVYQSQLPWGEKKDRYPKNAIFRSTRPVAAPASYLLILILL